MNVCDSILQPFYDVPHFFEFATPFFKVPFLSFFTYSELALFFVKLNLPFGLSSILLLKMDRFVMLNDPFHGSKLKTPVKPTIPQTLIKTPTPLKERSHQLQLYQQSTQILNHSQSPVQYSKMDVFDSIQANSTAITIDPSSSTEAVSSKYLFFELDSACRNLKTRYIEKDNQMISKSKEIEILKSQILKFNHELLKLKDSYKVLHVDLNGLREDNQRISNNCRILYNENRGIKRLVIENNEEIERQRKQIRLLKSNSPNLDITNSNRQFGQNISPIAITIEPTIIPPLTPSDFINKTQEKTADKKKVGGSRCSKKQES